MVLEISAIIDFAPSSGNVMPNFDGPPSFGWFDFEFVVITSAEVLWTVVTWGVHTDWPR